MRIAASPIPKGPSVNVPELSDAPVNDAEMTLIPLPKIAEARAFPSVFAVTLNAYEARSSAAKATSLDR